MSSIGDPIWDKYQNLPWVLHREIKKRKKVELLKLQTFSREYDIIQYKKGPPEDLCDEKLILIDKIIQEVDFTNLPVEVFEEWNERRNNVRSELMVSRSLERIFVDVEKKYVELKYPDIMDLFTLSEKEKDSVNKIIPCTMDLYTNSLPNTVNQYNAHSLILVFDLEFTIPLFRLKYYDKDQLNDFRVVIGHLDKFETHDKLDQFCIDVTDENRSAIEKLEKIALKSPHSKIVGRALWLLLKMEVRDVKSLELFFERWRKSNDTFILSWILMGSLNYQHYMQHMLEFKVSNLDELKIINKLDSLIDEWTEYFPEIQESIEIDQYQSNREDYGNAIAIFYIEELTRDRDQYKESLDKTIESEREIVRKEKELIATKARKLLAELKYQEQLKNQLLKLLSQFRSTIQVSLSRISQLLEIPIDRTEDLVMELLELQPSLGEYLELEQVFIKNQPLEEKSTNLYLMREKFESNIVGLTHFCKNCDVEQSILITVCPQCDHVLDFCMICRRGFSNIEEIDNCEHCGLPFHKNHLKEYRHVKGECPNCKN